MILGVRRIYRGLLLIVVCLVVFLLVGFGDDETGTERPTETGATYAQSAKRPNIVFILTDDLDTRSVRRMPYVKSLLADRGTTFQRAFVTNSVCCPSRTTILRGQYTHNHQIEGTRPPAGGYEKFQELRLERSTVATWLDDGGYRTVHLGKYLNGYMRTTHVPPGWDKWYGFNGGGYYDFTLNENGRNVSYSGRRNYQTDVLSNKAVRFIQKSAGGRQPFFMHLAPYAPHGPVEPAPRHEGMFNDAQVPRTPSYNERDVSDKPGWVRSRPQLTRAQKREMDEWHRNRLRTLQAADEMVRDVVRTLRKTGQLNDTYIVFTSDNGWHMGQHRLSKSKWTAYEEDIRVPLIVRGPGVPAGKKMDHLVINNDFAPTFAQMGRVSTPGFVDGRSLIPLLRSNPPPKKKWRKMFLVEAKDSGVYRRPAYRALRTNHLSYVEYSKGRYSSREQRELYNLRKDPLQLRSRHRGASSRLLKAMSSRIDTLSRCSGQSCRDAEDGSSGR